ncbi:CXXC motif containing zinc binding protein [Microplitis mediator]|uniref:CXXC motif containing zinc binding protein n=1 Tax=Microplitis mediator TaxID=375433 RepID=UPI0025576799|nr:CXXC motif containing zinc binding protein [Microplitis mediator]
MVKIGLKFQATLENIEELNPTDPNFRWGFKLKCSNCNESTDKWNYLSLSEEVPAPHGKDIHHLVSKCKLCLRINTVTIIEDSIKKYTAEDSEKFKTIAVFDCRGSEPTEFSPGGGWAVKAVDDGTEFEDVDLSDLPWADYCDKIKKPVSVDDIRYEFEKVK